MNLTDIIALALRNLRQAKLRTALTVIGVVIGVAAIITMVSFGLGLQQNIIEKTFARLDVFTSITVFGKSVETLIAMNERSRTENNDAAQTATPEQTDEQKRAVLDDTTIAEMAKIRGVRYAQPLINFQCFVRVDGRTQRRRIGGAPAVVENNPRFSKLIAGQHFSSDDAAEMIVAERAVGWLTGTARTVPSDRPRPNGRPNDGRQRGPFLPGVSGTDEERAEIARKVLGKEITLLTLRETDAQPDSIFGVPLVDLSDKSDEPTSPAGAEGEAARFEQHVFRVVGVTRSDAMPNLNEAFGAEMYVPVQRARRFREANRDPLEKAGEALAGDTGYQQAEVRVSDPTQVVIVQDQIKKMGFNSFSLNNQVDEIRRVFLIINGGLGLLGGIALLVASFGIANTMIMSILERTREIGIMKAIGGSDSEIMRIFFFEASLIGLLGGTFGVIAGWIVDRLANFAVNRWMLTRAEHIEFFSIPWYLWVGAIIFAVMISLLAAIYPSLRAARVDPIKALRHD